MLDPDTGEPTLVAESSAVDESPSWSPDGTGVAFLPKTGDTAQVVLANADGGGERRLALDSGTSATSAPHWSPDGRHLLFGSFDQATSNMGIAIADTNGAGARTIVEDAYAGAPIWSPDGSLIAFVGDDAGRALPAAAIRVVRPDGADDRTLAALEDVSGIAWQPVLAEPEPTGTPLPFPPKENGPIYFRVGGGDAGSWIDSVLADGTSRTTVFPIDAELRYSRIAFSPDGSRIAFDDSPNGLVTAAADGSAPVRVTDGANDSWPSWSPDGTKIAFSSTRFDPAIEGCVPGFPHEYRCPTDVYVMDVDGSNVVRITDDPTGEFLPIWSPDGTRIAFVREGDPASGTSEGIYSMDPDGSDVRRVSSSDGGSDFWPSWSPDGSRLAFAAIRNEDWGIWIVNADGSDEHMVLGGTGAGYVDDPVWSPDGTLIAFVGNLTVDDYSPDDALYVMAPDGSDARPLADAPRYGVAGDIAWRPIPSATVETVPLGEPAALDVAVAPRTGGS